MAINSNQVSFVKNIYFTDETQFLSIEWTNLGGFPSIGNIANLYPDTIAFGMSSKAPSDFHENTMEIPFETVNPYNSDGSFYVTYQWDISKYQSNIRSMLTAYKTTEVYVYSKGTKGENEYINWTLCYVSIADIDAVPIFTAEPSYVVTDSLSSGLTGNTSTIIRYVSNAQVSFACEARKQSTLKNASVKIGSKVSNIAYSTETTASSKTTISAIDGEVFGVTVLDSRGFRTTHYVAVERYIKYFFPTCSLTVTNPTASGGNTTLTADGLCFNGSFGKVANTITVQYRYKTTTGSYTSWRSMTVTRNGDKYTATASVSGLDYQTKYSFQARITDKITTITSIESIAKSQPVFDWGEDDFRFNVPVTVDGDLNVTGAFGLDGILEVGGLHVGSMLIDDPLLQVKTDDGYYQLVNLADLSIESGVWVPKCNACSSPDYAVGSYTRIGDNCIINFYFEGTTDTFLGDSNLYFSGIPYQASTARRWYGGGGNASGVSKASSVEYFSGWNIEGQLIYGRTVKGNTSDKKTIAYNGSATSYTFHYDTGAGYLKTGFTGQKIYCSGTIMYKIA